MTYAIDRAGRTAAALSLLVCAAMLLPPATALGSDGLAGKAPLQLAQATGPGPGTKPGPAQPPRPGAAGNHAQQPNAAAQGQEVERHIADLKRQLKITPEQEPQFNAFADVMRSNTQNVQSAASQQGQPGNALDELRAAEKLAELNVESLRRLVPVFTALYNGLDPQQKKTADKLFGSAGAGEQQRGGHPG
jgi:protein CpxP